MDLRYALAPVIIIPIIFGLFCKYSSKLDNFIKIKLKIKNEISHPLEEEYHENAETVHEVDRENARIGYTAAITIWGNLNRDHWSRFHAMVLINSIILSAFGLIIDKPHAVLFIKGLPIVGLILTSFWYLLMIRDFKFAELYASCARELENQYLWPCKAIRMGYRLLHYEKFKLERTVFELRWIENFRTKYIIELIILVFVIIYLYLIYYSNFVAVDFGIKSLPNQAIINNGIDVNFLIGANAS
jgi:hypothetical protein